VPSLHLDMRPIRRVGVSARGGAAGSDSRSPIPSWIAWYLSVTLGSLNLHGHFAISIVSGRMQGDRYETLRHDGRGLTPYWENERHDCKYATTVRRIGSRVQCV